MAQNTAGFQSVADLGFTPSVFTGRATTVISGGQVLYAGSQAAPVSSGANAFAVSDIWLAAPASGTNYPIGVAVDSVVASGTNNVAGACVRGLVLMVADGAIVPGQFVGAANGAHAVTAVGSQDNPIVALNRVIGRALTSAGSEQYVLVNVNL